MLSSGGGCTQAIIARCRVAWGKFKRLLPILTNKHLSLEARGRVYYACVRSALLRRSETWGPTVHDVQRLKRADRSIVRWLCGVKCATESLPRSSMPCSGWRRSPLPWVLEGSVGTVMSSGSIATVEKMEGKGRGRGRPRKSWNECVREARKNRGLTGVNPTNRPVWRSAI